MFHFEHHRQRLAPRRQFFSRLMRTGLLVLAFTAGSLGIGMAGYGWLGGLGPADSFLNAAMILSGMGPVDTLTSPAAKIFSGLYALYSGFFVLVMAGLLLAPLAHRLLHRFHVEGQGRKGR